MINKENCEIVKDLLPNYIDRITSNESKIFIEKHMENCSKCKDIFNNMKKDIEKENNNLKKEVKYAKKYNRKIKFLIFIIVFILFIIFASTFFRNAIIIKNLSKKASSYINCNNYHMTWSSYSKEDLVIFDIYYKDGKYLSYFHSYNFSIDDSRSDFGKITEYYNGNGQRVTYADYDKSVSYENVNGEDADAIMYLKPYSMAHSTMYDEDFITFIKSCFVTQISSEKYNNRKCYRFKNFNDDTNILYIDKETGLSIKSESGVLIGNRYVDTFSDIEIEFDIVTDEDVKMPSTDGYTKK